MRSLLSLLPLLLLLLQPRYQPPVPPPPPPPYQEATAPSPSTNRFKLSRSAYSNADTAMAHDRDTATTAARTTSPLSSPMLALAVCCVGSGPGCGTAVTSETMKVKGHLPCDCQACLPNPASAATRPVRTLPRCSHCCCCCPCKKDLLEESLGRCRKISTV
jgi:hypothetical protein